VVVAIEVRQVLGYDDLGRWVATRNETGPDVSTVEMTALLRATELDHVDLIALEDDEPVGTAFISGDPRSVQSRRPYVEVTVPQRHRGRGVGTALLAAVGRHARALRYEALRCTAQADDPDAIAFLLNRGFAVTRRTEELALSLDRDASLPAVDSEHELVWLSDRPDLLPAMYDVAAAAAEQRPDFAAGFVRSEAEWRTYELGSPLVRLELTALARAGDEVRGYAIAQDVPGENALYHRAIATRPGPDERSATRALIAGQTHAAHAAGIMTMLALPWNEPLERLYADLGYRSRRTWLELEGPVPA
jgi:GNAT superfamily N-acetyltransferase